MLARIAGARCPSVQLCVKVSVGIFVLDTQGCSRIRARNSRCLRVNLWDQLVATTREYAPGLWLVSSTASNIAAAAFVGIRRLRHPCEFSADLVEVYAASRHEFQTNGNAGPCKKGGWIHFVFPRVDWLPIQATGLRATPRMFNEQTGVESPAI
jgi:hypothetical protein